MTGNFHTKFINKSNFHQSVLLDSKGIIRDSCDSLFDSSIFKSKSIGNYFYFLASELPAIWVSEANKITFSQMQTTQDCLPGFYDFVFSKVLIKDQKYVLWELFDYTHIYEEYLKVQQIKNEIDIHKQYLTRQQDISSNVNNNYSENFFQSKYLAKQKFEQENLVHQLLNNKVNNQGLSENQRESRLTDLLNLRGHLEIMIDEINQFLDHMKDQDVQEIEIRKFFDDFIVESSLEKDLIVIYSNTLPRKIRFKMEVLNRIISLICKYDSSRSENVNDKSSLNIGFHKGSKEEDATLSINYIQNLSTKIDLNEDSSKRVIGISILKSLITTLGGSLMSKYSYDNHFYGALVSLPIKKY